MPGKRAEATHLTVVLHEKEPARKVCICGSNMRFDPKKATMWVCEHQEMTGEPTSIRLKRADVPELLKRLKR